MNDDDIASYMIAEAIHIHKNKLFDFNNTYVFCLHVIFQICSYILMHGMHLSSPLKQYKERKVMKSNFRNYHQY